MLSGREPRALHSTALSPSTFKFLPLLCPRFFSSARSTALSRLIWNRIEDGLPSYLFPFIAVLARRDATKGFRRRRARSRRPFHGSKTEFLREGSSPSSCVHTTMWRICCIYRAFHRLAKVLERLWITCMEMYTFHIQTKKFIIADINRAWIFIVSF